tara:strand:- start:3 stop:176 length:174 start_codon:yes stop_codon:yes gene_type:complete
MAFTIGQNVNVTTNGVTTSGTIAKINPLGSNGAYTVQFADGSKKAYFGANVSQIVAA